MCIFKFNKLVKVNSNQDIMSSLINKNMKLDTTIDVEYNFIGLVYFRDKFILTLPTGSYKLTDGIFHDIISKNEHKNRNNKKKLIDFNIHYINIAPQTIETQFSMLASFKHKTNYSLKAEYVISSPKIFAKELLTTWYRTTSNRTNRYIKSWFKDFSIYVARKKFKSKLNFDTQLKGYATRYFKKYGITIQEISLTNLENNTIKVMNNENSSTSINENNSNDELFVPVYNSTTDSPFVQNTQQTHSKLYDTIENIEKQNIDDPPSQDFQSQNSFNQTSFENTPNQEKDDESIIELSKDSYSEINVSPKIPHIPMAQAHNICPNCHNKCLKTLELCPFCQNKLV